MTEDNQGDLPQTPIEESPIPDPVDSSWFTNAIRFIQSLSTGWQIAIISIIFASICGLSGIIIAGFISLSSAPEWAQCQASLDICRSIPSPIPQTRIVEVTEIIEVTEIVEITSTPIPTNSTAETPEDESANESSLEQELIFEENFEVNKLDRNKWQVGCNPESEAFLLDGELHLQFNGHDGERSCILKPLIEDGQNISFVSMKLTILKDTNDFGWVGIFTDCGDKYLNFVGNRYFFTLSREAQVGGFQNVEAINSLPVTRILSIQIDDNKVSLITAENNDEILYDIETTCYADFSEIRIGVDVDISQGGQVSALIDNVKIWAQKVQPTSAE